MKRPLCFCALIMTAIVFIYLEFFLSDLTENGFGEQDGSYVELEGIVSKKEIRPDFSGKAKTVIFLIPREKIKGNFKYVECCLCGGSYEPAIGEKVFLGGELKAFFGPRNPGEFDSRLYYSTLKIAYRINNAEVKKADGKKNAVKEALFDIRQYAGGVLDRYLDADDSAVLRAMLLGDKAYMSDELKDMYKNSGIIHILAVSGLHISILGIGLYKLLRKLRTPRLVGAGVSITVMLLYGSMCGMSTSAFRAICMFVLRIVAPLVGRTYDMLTGLAIAEIMLLIDQPLYLYNSGFLFSFGAIVGIAVVRPRLAEMMNIGKKNRKNGVMRFADEQEQNHLQRAFGTLQESLITGVAILIVTLPVYTSFYYTYPILSLLLNLLVIPVVGILMITGIICIATAVIFPVLSIVPCFAVHVILSLYKLLCGFAAAMPFNTLYLGHSDKVRVVIYCVLVAGGLAYNYWICKKNYSKNSFDNMECSYYYMKHFRQLFFISLAMLCAAFFVLCFHIPPEFRMTMIDVGQGDGILITVRDKNVLIDGGSTSRSSVGKYSIIPYLKYEAIGRLDAVVLTHEDKDHISGILDIMDDMENGGIRIKKLILPDIAEESKGENYRKLEERAKELGIGTLYISEGDKLSEGNAEFLCINPEKDGYYNEANEYSTVLFMKYKGLTALFTGDVEGAGQEHIRNAIKRNGSYFNGITLLKVAHHGSQYTTDDEFLDLINPQVALISCGVDNSYGHPHDELLERLKSRDIRVLRTDESGAVSITMKNGRLVVDEMLDNN